MIRFEGVTVTYPDATQPALRDVELTVPEGDLCLVVGRTGVGKSTLLGSINGLVPHFTGGTMSGRVTVDGRDTRDAPPRELAELVGVVVQDPIQGFVADIVEDELAYGMEQLAVPPDVMRKRVEETLDLLGLAELRRRPLRTLSGGQQQRVAIGSVLTPHPRVLVLDEPTSALDPAAAEDVLAALTRLVHDLGLTVVVAEHRLERVVEYADLVVAVEADGRVRSGDPREMMASTEVAPPIVRLGRSLGWDPLPLSVREARRASRDLVERLALVTPPSARVPAGHDVALSATDIVVRYGATVAVDRVDLSIGAGEVVALMGRNGSGKSSLLWALQGGGTRTRGTVALVDGADPADLDERGRYGRITLVPQSPSDLLYLPTVAAECDAADASAPDQPAGRCRRILDGIVPGIADDRHPRDLSEGQRLALALAVQLTADPAVVMLDEPTRGLDEPAKARFTDHIRRLAADGRAVLVATHDVELVAAVADRVVVMADGEVVADGPTPEVVVSSPIFAPQVAKVLRPSPWLTAQQVTDALGANR